LLTQCDNKLLGNARSYALYRSAVILYSLLCFKRCVERHNASTTE